MDSQSCTRAGLGIVRVENSVFKGNSSHPKIYWFEECLKHLPKNMPSPLVLFPAQNLTLLQCPGVKKPSGVYRSCAYRRSNLFKPLALLSTEPQPRTGQMTSKLSPSLFWQTLSYGKLQRHTKVDIINLHLPITRLQQLLRQSYFICTPSSLISILNPI